MTKTTPEPSPAITPGTAPVEAKVPATPESKLPPAATPAGKAATGQPVALPSETDDAKRLSNLNRRLSVEMDKAKGLTTELGESQKLIDALSGQVTTLEGQLGTVGTKLASAEARATTAEQGAKTLQLAGTDPKLKALIPLLVSGTIAPEGESDEDILKSLGEIHSQLLSSLGATAKPMAAYTPPVVPPAPGTKTTPPIVASATPVDLTALQNEHRVLGFQGHSEWTDAQVDARMIDLERLMADHGGTGDAQQ